MIQIHYNSVFVAVEQVCYRIIFPNVSVAVVKPQNRFYLFCNSKRFAFLHNSQFQIKDYAIC